jgi:hypothetical protein
MLKRPFLAAAAVNYQAALQLEAMISISHIGPDFPYAAGHSPFRFTKFQLFGVIVAIIASEVLFNVFGVRLVGALSLAACPVHISRAESALTERKLVCCCSLRVVPKQAVQVHSVHASGAMLPAAHLKQAWPGCSFRLVVWCVAACCIT